MSAKQAAEYLGCHVSHVRRLLAKGKIKGKLRRINDKFSWWEVDKRSLENYHRRPQKQGWPRGMPRS